MISPQARTLIDKASKHNGSSISSIIDNLILQKLSDPIKNLMRERKILGMKINSIDTKIKNLEEIKEKNKQGGR